MGVWVFCVFAWLIEITFVLSWIYRISSFMWALHLFITSLYLSNFLSLSFVGWGLTGLLSICYLIQVIWAGCFFVFLESCYCSCFCEIIVKVAS